MRAKLILEAGECIPAAIDLQPGSPATLGRSRDNTIVLKDDASSRLHAKIYFDSGRWFLRDFGMNGTLVNGQRVNGSTGLTDGSSIQIGIQRFSFHCSAPAPAPVKMPPSGSVDVGMTQLNRKGTSPQVGHPATRACGGQRSSIHEMPVHRSIAPPTKAGPGIDRTKVIELHERQVPPAPLNPAEALDTGLKIDELTALCRFMTDVVAAQTWHDAIRIALETLLRQTTARVVGYLSLEPTDPTPKLVLPEEAKVDVPLSRKLTERVRQSRKMFWLFTEELPATADSLNSFTDAVCVPLAGSDGHPFAALHVYRSAMSFSERDVQFIEAVGRHLAKAIELHRHRRVLEAENVRLRTSAPVADDLIGHSAAIAQLRQQIARAAPLPINVLIQGESGSGKELVAQALHRTSPRAQNPFVCVNCAAIAPTLLEAELFGYRKGAFSGADRDHPGLFEQADEGTLFLDEVGELTLECQAKLLRVIEGKSFRPVGARADIKVDVRVVAATHRDLEKEVKAGRFRQDLLFRLKVIPIRVPPLREHADDIADLARFFLDRIGSQCRRTFRLTAAALRKLELFAWPGNVRQLRAVLESTAVLSETDLIDADAIPIESSVENDTSPADFPQSLDVDDLETWAIHKALLRTSGNVSQAAKLLGMSRDTLHTKIKKKSISRDQLLAEVGSSLSN